MKFRGTARLGMWRVRWPFAKLSIEQDAIRISGLGLNCVLKKSEVRRLEYSASLFSEGVRISHANSSVDPHVIFRPFRPQKLIVAAKELGYSTISTRA